MTRSVGGETRAARHNSSASVPASDGRSAGSLARHRWMASDRLAGTPASTPGAIGTSVRARSATSSAVVPVNGALPVASSYSTAPRP